MSASGGISLYLTVVFVVVVVVVVVAFWNSVSSDVPHLTSLANRNMYNCRNSADAERSFSIYNLAFSDRRRRCSEKKIKGFGVLVL